MRRRSTRGAPGGLRAAVAALLVVGLSSVATAGVVVAASQPAAAATCPVLEPQGPEGWPTPVPAPSAGVDWSGCDLSGAYIISSTLTDADLSDADLSGAQLWGSDLSGADLRGTDFTGATLGGRCDNGSFSISGADLDGADLTDADLTSADLGGEFGYVGTQQCVVYGAELDDVTISGAVLSGADLLGVTSGGITGQPASLPVHWLLDSGTLSGPSATCARVTGKTTLRFRHCLWTIMDPVTSTPSVSLGESVLATGGTLSWRIVHPQSGGARQTSDDSSAALASPGQGVCPAGSTEEDVTGVLSAGFEAGDSLTAQLCRKTRSGSFTLAPGTTAGL